MNLRLLSFIFTLLILACNFKNETGEAINDNHQPEKEMSSVKKSDSSNMYEVKTNSGKNILITESHPKGESLSSVEINSKNFDSSSPISFNDIDPISNILVSDLDKNGFDEIYIISTSAGSGSYSKITGLVSNKDSNLLLIYFDNNLKPGGIFEGYTGHDLYSIENNLLVRSFPVSLKGSTNARPTGGQRKIYYKLANDETGWRLEIVRSENLN